MAPFDGKSVTSNLMAILIYALTVTIYNVFASEIKCKKFDLENEDQGQEREKLDLHHSTGNA